MKRCALKFRYVTMKGVLYRACLNLTEKFTITSFVEYASWKAIQRYV